MTTTRLLKEYYNGNLVQLFENGTKIRTGNNEAWYPESIDLKVTDYCDMGCPFCHEKSTVLGKHAKLETVIAILNKLPQHGGIELAIGGGNPLSWIFMEEFVQWAKNKFILNITLHENHLKKLTNTEINLLTSFAGIGVSVISSKPLSNYIEHPHLVAHMIAGIHSIDFIKDTLKNNNKALILGYKTYGRGEQFLSEKITSEISRLKYNLRNIMGLNQVLAFDNLAIEQLKPERFIKNWEEIFMGEDATHTLYVDSVKNEYAKSSFSSKRVSTDFFPKFEEVR